MLYVRHLFYATSNTHVLKVSIEIESAFDLEFRQMQHNLGFICLLEKFADIMLGQFLFELRQSVDIVWHDDDHAEFFALKK